MNFSQQNMRATYIFCSCFGNAVCVCNIVRYIDKKVSDDGVPRLILEYVDGFTFQENRYFCIIKNVWHRQNKRGAPDWD